MNKKEFGGAGSGNFGHAGVPGEVGGSAPSSGEGSGAATESPAAKERNKKYDLGAAIRERDAKYRAKLAAEKAGVAKVKPTLAQQQDKEYKKFRNERDERAPARRSRYYSERETDMKYFSVPVEEHEIFRAGTHTTKAGETISYSEKDLDEMCETFNAEEPPAYIPGHSSDWPGVTMIPKLGEITKGLKRVGDKLYAVGAEFTDRLAGWVREGFYDQRSCEIGRVDGKLKLFAIAMLGAQPPAVKGMPPINADMLLSDYMFSRPETAIKVEFADPVAEPVKLQDHIDEVEIAGKDSIKTDLQEICATSLNNLYTMIDEEKDPQELCDEIYKMTNDLLSKLRMHSNFMEQLETIEEKQEGEYSNHKGFWKEFGSKIRSLLSTHKPQEVIVDNKQEESYKKQIADLEKEKAELADGRLRAEIKSFCKENKLDTNKHQEMHVEDMLFAAAKANQTIEFAGAPVDGKETKVAKPLLEVLQTALKSFQLAAPATEEIAAFSEPLKADPTTPVSNKMKMAEAYVAAHPEQFTEFSKQVQKVAHALKLESNQQIHFTSTKE